MRILVSGGAGFLGSNLCATLIASGDTVYCLDNLTTGAGQNVDELYESGRFHFIVGSATEPPVELRVDQVYSLASATAPGAYQADPEGTVEANVAGTKALLEFAAKQRARMLFTSSIRVTERFDRDGPHACYITGKIIGENLCLTYNQECGIDVKVARLYNTYGPRMALNDSRVIPQFVLRALRGEPLKIVGDGLQRDSFCYVDDMLDGLIAYMNSDVKLGPMEFGYPSPISIIDLAQLVVRLAGSSSPIEFNGVDRPAEEMEIKHRRPVPDIGEAREKLGWNPQTTLEEGLPRIIAYYRERL